MACSLAERERRRQGRSDQPGPRAHALNRPVIFRSLPGFPQKGSVSSVEPNVVRDRHSRLCPDQLYEDTCGIPPRYPRMGAGIRERYRRPCALTPAATGHTPGTVGPPPSPRSSRPDAPATRRPAKPPLPQPGRGRFHHRAGREAGGEHDAEPVDADGHLVPRDPPSLSWRHGRPSSTRPAHRRPPEKVSSPTSSVRHCARWTAPPGTDHGLQRGGRSAPTDPRAPAVLSASRWTVERKDGSPRGSCLPVIRDRRRRGFAECPFGVRVAGGEGSRRASS